MALKQVMPACFVLLHKLDVRFIAPLSTRSVVSLQKIDAPSQSAAVKSLSHFLSLEQGGKAPSINFKNYRCFKLSRLK